MENLSESVGRRNSMNLSFQTTGRLFESLFLSFVISVIAAIYATKFAIRTGLIDRPNAQPHKIHHRNVPYSGGIAIFATTIILVSCFHRSLNQEIIGLIGASGIVFAFALADDYLNLNWRYKFSGQILAAVVLMITGTQTHLFEAETFRFIPGMIRPFCDYALTLFWVVFITNGYNLIDSADGLVLGISSLGLGFLMIAALDARQSALALLCSILLGSCVALMLFNTYPAFLFMGDSGAQFLGFVLSAAAILYTPPSRLQAQTWFLPILVLGIPIFDTVLVIISRYRKGLHFYTSGTDHTFHRLMKMGFSMQQSTIIMHGAEFALDVIAFFAISREASTANLIFAMVILAGILAIVFFEKEKLWTRIIQFNQESKNIP